MSETPIKESTPVTEPAAASTTATSSTSAKPQIATVVKTLQFAWFVGHVVTLISFIFYALTYIRIGSRAYKFWYQLGFFGVVESYGILLYQLFRKNGPVLNVFLRDDNAHYFWLGANLLLLRPYVVLTTIPFALFSVFHVLAYSKANLFPVFGLDKHPVATKVGNFISTYNIKSIQVASATEIATLVWLFIRVITIRKRSLVPLIIYVIFVKVRFEKSVFIREYFKKIELKIEDSVNKSNNPTVKQAWIQVKGVNKKIGSFYLVNDFTKAKVAKE